MDMPFRLWERVPVTFFGIAMPHVPILPPDQASKAAKDVYEEFYLRMRFPAAPNFIMTQGHSPSVARGTWELVKNVLVGGEIPRWKKELIFVAISRERNCRYCVAAHIACCRMLGVDVERIATNLLDTAADPAGRDMIMFAMKCAREPQAMTTDDYDGLRKHGFSQAQIMELVGMAALAVYANIIADATGMEADRMFDDY
jgi:uncharacterized peroxidase-related enzyme